MSSTERTMMQPATDAAEGEAVYTLAQAARLKGVSYHTVSRAIRSGKLPHRRLGRMAFVAAGDLHAWQPMVQRAPKKYRRRSPEPDAPPAFIDLAAGERAEVAQRFAILAETLHVAAMDRPLDDFLALLCERLARALGLERVTIHGVDRERGVVRRLARIGGAMSDLPPEVPLASVPAFVAFLERGESTVREATSFGPPPARLDDVTDLFVAPLRIGERVLGTIQGDRGGDPFAFDADQLAFAQAIANQAAVALEIARLRGSLAARARGERPA